MTKKRKYKPTGKIYTFTSFDQILNVLTVDNMMNLGSSFIEHFLFAIDLCDTIRKEHPELCEGKLNSEITQAVTFQWLDDGITGVTQVNVTIKETGEVIEIKRK